MTDDEMNVMRRISDVLIAFCSLPECTDSDRQEVAGHLLAIRDILKRREAVRTHPDVFRCEANKNDANKG